MEKDIEKVISKLAPDIARQITQSARNFSNEADFRREVAKILEDTGLSAGLTITPRDEFSVARGRVDSVYNRLVLEYKRPGVLKNSNTAAANQSVIQQVKDYIIDVAKREKREAHRLAGVATDGIYLIFVRRVGEGWSIDDPLPINSRSIELFLRLLFSLSKGAALVPENLVDDFGPKNIRAQRAIRAFYTSLHSTKHPLVGKLFEQWRLFFSEATDYKEWADKIESKKEFRSFVGSIWTKEQIKHLDAAKVFFVLHTYYALLIKLVASLAAARFAGGISAPLSMLASKQREELKHAMTDLEHGGLFREYGIRNFLEGDFFGWYIPAWNDEIEDAVSDLIKRLADYDPGTLELAPENARDLLKKLYHYLLPKEIRHDLGEYYTPDWLAERLIRQTLGSRDLGDATKRVLDPSCGSGTFLVILIKYIRERAEKEKRNASDTLRLILRNVIGIDLNPLAVIAARTNYLLALGDLLKEPKGDIDIPVYQADSVLTPAKGEDLFDDGIYSLKTSVGIFKIPAPFAKRELMDILADILDECVEAAVSSEAFIHRIGKAVQLNIEESKATNLSLAELFKQLKELHAQGLNGVWARIIKNSFAPLFLEPCHYIVGNPPWVNWEHLPDEYRRHSMPLWQHYGLFPKRKKGMATILGSAKYDISMLMTYVVADRHLKLGGKLGFILTQSLFKTSGAGQGFRRFILPDNTEIGPLVVEDMVELKPFEGAANRTAVGVFVKGGKLTYPISYQYWKKRSGGRGSGIGFDTPYEEVTSNKITYLKWYAEPVSSKDITSSWITGRRNALNALRKILGTSYYNAREGVNTGGANAIFWFNIIGDRSKDILIVTNHIEGARKKVERVQVAIEKQLIYPLLRGSEIKRWGYQPTISIIITHEKGNKLNAIPFVKMESDYPKTFSYLKSFEKELRSRPAYKRYFNASAPWWSMFDIGDYTFKEIKVVWPWISERVRASVVVSQTGKVIIPEHNTSFVHFSSLEEANYFCALFNSAPCEAAIILSYGGGGGGLAAPSVLERINIPKFKIDNQLHRQLAELSKKAHHSPAEEIGTIEEHIDVAAAMLWGLSRQELIDIKKSLEEM